MAEISSVGRGGDRLRVKAGEWLGGKSTFETWREKAQQKGMCTPLLIEALKYQVFVRKFADFEPQKL